MWEIISDIYEPATGMKVNVTKTEGLRLGRLKRKEFEKELGRSIRTPLKVTGTHIKLEIQVSKGWGIEWCKEGDYIVSLGVPIGWNYDLKAFWRSKYYKCKSLMAGWNDVERMSPQGSAMVGNSMVYSRFRYWAHCLAMSKEVRTAIDRDTQNLVWGKDIHYDPDELGSEKSVGFMIREAQYNPRKQGGVGMLYWEGHEKALTSYTLFQYCNGRSMQWKGILDWWFAKFYENRGAVFSTIPPSDLFKSRKVGRASCLPLFYRRALKHLRELTLIPIREAQYTSQEEAQAEVLWTSPRIHITNSHLSDKWRFDLTLNRVNDLIDPFTGDVWSDNKMRRFIEQALRVENDCVISKGPADTLGFRQQIHTPISTLLKQWHQFADDAGRTAILTAAGDQPPQQGVFSDQARKMMAAMGWKEGEGIGKRGDGMPYPPSATGSTSKEGLGFRPSRPPASETKRRKVEGLELPSGELAYGYKGERNGQVVLQEVECTGRGKLVMTGNAIPIPIDPDLNLPMHTREALMWDGGPVGLADACFPHPSGWKLEGSKEGQTLEYTTIRKLTALYRNQIAKPPNCEAKWESVVGHTLPWVQVWSNLNNPLLTPRDTKSHFRTIHRSIRTRNISAAPPPDEHGDDHPNDERLACRLCLVELERFSHIAKCWTTHQVFNPLVSFINKCTHLNVSLTVALIHLGVVNPRSTLPPGLAALHTMMWKFFLIDYTRVDTDKITFDPGRIWKAAVFRLENKIRARHTYLENRTSRAINLGRNPPPLNAEEHSAPLARIVYHDEYSVTRIDSPHYSALLKELEIDQ
jgi:hypothetical protein